MEPGVPFKLPAFENFLIKRSFKKHYPSNLLSELKKTKHSTFPTYSKSLVYHLC